MSWDLTSEIAQQRTDAANTFNDSCVITRLAETSDGQGGMVQAWTPVGTADCRIVANTGLSKQVGAQFERVGAFTLTVAPGTNLLENDKVTLAGNETVYRVQFVDDVRAWQTAVRAQVDEDVTE